jgi:hypothetical protein
MFSIKRPFFKLPSFCSSQFRQEIKPPKKQRKHQLDSIGVAKKSFCNLPAIIPLYQVKAKYLPESGEA